MAKKQKGNGGSQAFAVAQQIGKSLFLPIAVLPPAGILLGIGSSFTNATTIATYILKAYCMKAVSFICSSRCSTAPAMLYSATWH